MLVRVKLFTYIMEFLNITWYYPQNYPHFVDDQTLWILKNIVWGNVHIDTNS